MGVKRLIMPVDLPESESISGTEINLTVCAVRNGVLCCNLAERKSVLKMCISKHCHEVTGFLSWIGTYCVSCVVQQRKQYVCKTRHLIQTFSTNTSVPLLTEFDSITNTQ